MDVLLMQHGMAEAADVNAARPLTDAGRAEVAAVAAHARSCGVTVDRIIHSDKLRAVQTAVELADGLGCATVSHVAGLHPGDSVEKCARAWVDPLAEGSLLMVGHLPFLDRLAALLVTGDPSGHVVAFRNAALVALTPAPSPGGFAVAWILTPRLARP